MAESGERGRERGTVTWSECDEVVRVEMCSPPVNELDAHVVCKLSAALDAFERSSAQVLLIGSDVAHYFATSAAPRHAVAGRHRWQGTWAGLDEVCGRLVNGDRPSIAVINGFALDGGLKLAMACTARVGTAEAQMGMPRSQVGPIFGRHAHEIGLVDRLAEPDRLGYEALKFAAALMSPLGPTVTELLRRVDEAFDPSAGRRENHQQRQPNNLLVGPGARGRLRTFLGLRRGERD
jgi:enoyl-CoA hydratase